MLDEATPGRAAPDASPCDPAVPEPLPPRDTTVPAASSRDTAVPAPSRRDTAALATAHMQRGLALMADARHAASVTAALDHFTQALAIRRELPRDDARAAYALAASWMNRAEALLALGGAANLTLAVESLDAAVQVLEPLPLDSDPRCARRLAIALQNRALARGRLGRDTWTMVPDLFRALDLLGAPDSEDDVRLAAAMWVNIGVAQLLEPAEDAWRRAIASARQALNLVATSEGDNARMAEVGLQARHVSCRAAARCLDRAGTRAVTPDVHVATDAVDEALALISGWERRGYSAFRSLASELYDFGRRVYAIYQPHFVDDFEREYAALCSVLHPTARALV